MKFDRWRTFWVIAIVGFFGGSVALVFTGDDSGTAAVAAEQGQESSFSSVDVPKTPAGCLADSATLEDLRRQKSELETRKAELTAREAELKARELALNEQIKSLSAARDDLEKIDQGKKSESDAKVAKLVDAVENMNPKAAAGLIGSIDEALATATMARLSTAKLAKVLNVMDPARSAKLSELLAGVARAKTRTASHDVAVATTERAPAAAAASAATTSPLTDGPSKGGDTNDGKSHEQASNRTTAGGDSSAPSR